jgi:DNA-binding transcriptional MerR regulator
MGEKPRRMVGKLRAQESGDIASFSGTVTLTLSQLADALVPIAPDPAVTRQQIRHWTREGALQPTEFEHEGPGKHRHYSRDARYSAAVLRVLTVAGLPISHSRFLKDLMRQVSPKAAEWNAAYDKGEVLALPPMIVGVTATKDGGAIQVAEERLKDERGFKTADVVLEIEIDLTKLFTKVAPARG